MATVNSESPLFGARGGSRIIAGRSKTILLTKINHIPDRCKLWRIRRLGRERADEMMEMHRVAALLISGLSFS